MNFKKITLGLLMLVAICISACNEKYEPVAPQEDNSAISSYITLNLVGPQGTKTTGTATEVGTAGQNAITSALVFLTGASNEVKELGSNDLIATANGATTKPFQVQKGSYQVYVVANPTEELKSLAASAATSTVISDITENLMKTQYAADNTFIMFSESNGADDQQGADITVTDENTLDNPATTANPIKLDRLAAQVRVTFATATENGTTTDFNNAALNIEEIGASFITSVKPLGYKLLNGITKTNLQQKWEAGISSNPENMLLTPSTNAGTNTAGSQDFYNHLTDFRTIARDAEDHYTTAKDDYASINPYVQAFGPIFFMENSPTNDNTTAKKGNTTGLVFQFQVTNSLSDEKAGANCFYSYNSQFFASLEAVQEKYPQAFDAATGDNKLAAAEAELAAAYASANKQQEISNFRTKYDILVYTDGLMYYTYYIKDRNYVYSNDVDKDAANYYAVMRNTIYTLNVSSLLRVGTDIPGGWGDDPDPDDPIDSDKAYMLVEIEVNPWVLSNEPDVQLK